MIKGEQKDTIIFFIARSSTGELTKLDSKKLSLIGDLKKLNFPHRYTKSQLIDLINTINGSEDYILGFLLSNNFYYINSKYSNFFVDNDCIITSDLKEKCKKDKLRRIKYGR